MHTILRTLLYPEVLYKTLSRLLGLQDALRFGKKVLPSAKIHGQAVLVIGNLDDLTLLVPAVVNVIEHDLCRHGRVDYLSDIEQPTPTPLPPKEVTVDLRDVGRVLDAKTLLDALDELHELHVLAMSCQLLYYQGKLIVRRSKSICDVRRLSIKELVHQLYRPLDGRGKVNGSPKRQVLHFQNFVAIPVM